MKKIFVIILPVFAFVFSGYGQELNVPNPRFITQQWKATWITNPEISGNEYAVILFRNTFEVKSVPKQLIISVSADNKYELFVNGTRVCIGPQLSDIRHWRYETIDIAPFLVPGKNVIAAEVVNFGPGRFFGMQSFRTAFLLNNVEGDHNININTTQNGNWKAFWNKAIHEKVVRWRTSPKTIIGGFYAANPTDSLNAQDYPWGWEKVEFNDEQWEPAVFCESASAFGGGFGWLLEPRNTPLQVQNKERIPSLLSCEPIQIGDGFLSGKGTQAVPANTKVTLLLDNHVLTIGYPHLEIAKGKNSVVRIGYAENLFIPNTAKKGNRNEWKGKQFVGLTDVFVTDGGDRTFRPTWLRSYRFVQIEVETKDEPLIIKDLYNLYTSSPIQTVGKFSTDNQVYNGIFDLCERTIRLCTQDYFLSDAYYETMQYLGDSKVHALVWQDLTGNDLHTRNALQQFHYSRLWDGNLTSCYPLKATFVHPTYSVIWIDMLYDYLRYKGDKDYIRQFVPGIHQTLAMFDQLIGKNGIAGQTRWNYFVDWYQESSIGGLAPGQDGSNSAVVTLHYVYALQNAAKIFEQLGDEQSAKKYRARAKDISSKVASLCYDNLRMMMAERPDKSYFDQHTNIMAILTETVPSSEYEPLLKRILEDETLGQATYYYRFYLIEALIKANAPHLLAQALKPWEQLVADGLTTALERFESSAKPTRSECHPWSTAPVYAFYRLIAGIRTQNPDTVVIEPYLGDLKSVSGVYPHPKGNISFQFEKSKKGIRGTVEMPADIEGVLKINGKEINLIQGKNAFQ